MNQMQYIGCIANGDWCFSSCHSITIFLTSFNLYLYKLVVDIYLNFLYQVLLLCYPFLWLKLYLHMFKQRRSKLGKRHEKKKLWSLDLFQIQMLVNCHLLVLLEFWVLGYRLLQYSSNYFAVPWSINVTEVRCPLPLLLPCCNCLHDDIWSEIMCKL